MLFIVLSYSIYRKIEKQENALETWQKIRESFHGPESWMLWAVIILCLVNWGIEARKWQVLVKPIQSVSLFKAFKAVLAGLAMSLFIPNRVGEYFGRILYMDEGNRLRSIALTFVGGFSQLIVTLVAGTIALFYMKFTVLDNETWTGLPSYWLNGLLFIITGGTLFLLLIYYKLSLLVTWFEKIPFISKYRYFIQNLEEFHWKELTRVLSLSAGRFLVFVAQYLLILHVFQVYIPIVPGIAAVCVLFLLLAIIPTIPMAEIGLRGEVSTRLFGLYSTNTVGILFAAGGIWFINLIIPALIGSLFVLGVKLYKKQT